VAQTQAWRPAHYAPHGVGLKKDMPSREREPPCRADQIAYLPQGVVSGYDLVQRPLGQVDDIVTLMDPEAARIG
jgi:hypothetical protein